MERKHSKKTIGFLAILFFSAGCGYFENDHTEYQKKIMGNILIQKQENMDVNDLVFAESDEIYSVIVEDCKTVYYNQEKKELYAEGFINNSNDKYYKITIIDGDNKKITGAIKKRDDY